LTGANGFIGSHVLAGLLDAGHAVVAAVRSPEALTGRFPEIRCIGIDLNADTQPEAWTERLAGVDAVVNCAGVLQSDRTQSIEAIHHSGPAALFEACATVGVRRVIHVSAISADTAAGTAYALSKLRGEDALRRHDIDWVVLRPSLVYGEGSYGGTSLLRGLAGLPWVVPVVGEGAQPFQPIHVGDLVRTVLVLLSRPDVARRTLEPVGPERLTLAEIVHKLRAWLGFRRARLLRVPLPLVRLVCRVGDLVGAGPLRTTALAQLEYGNAAPPQPFIAAIGFTPRSMDAALRARPAQVQDRWHARLFFARPLLTALLAVLWLWSGVLGLLVPWEQTAHLLGAVGIGPGVAGPLGTAASLLDLAMAALVVLGKRRAAVGCLQIAVIVAYTAFLTVAMPALWLDPFGPLLKNLPIIGAIAVWMAIGEDR
jgi:uncharacterized protein YbjT (DUF2867 family)